MTLDEAIKLHGADAVFTAASAGACENFEPLKAMGLHVDTIEAADQISTAVYRSMSAEEKAALYWEAAQDMYKNREPVRWDDVDYQIAPRMRDESEADYLQRQMLLELVQEQLEKRRASE
jgi:hypothetical protein